MQLNTKKSREQTILPSSRKNHIHYAILHAIVQYLMYKNKKNEQISTQKGAINLSSKTNKPTIFFKIPRPISCFSP